MATGSVGCRKSGGTLRSDGPGGVGPQAFRAAAQPAVVSFIAEQVGKDRVDALLAAVQDPQWKQRLVDEGNRAVERGVAEAAIGTHYGRRLRRPLGGRDGQLLQAHAPLIASLPEREETEGRRAQDMATPPLT